MDIKQMIQFCSQKNNNLYSFHCPSGAPLGELYDAAFEILNEVTKCIQEAAQKAAPKDISTVEVPASKPVGE